MVAASPIVSNSAAAQRSMRKFATRNAQPDTRQVGSPSEKPYMGDVKVNVPTSLKDGKKRKSKQNLNANQEKYQQDLHNRHHDNESSRSTVSSADAAVSTTASTSRPRHGEDPYGQAHFYSHEHNGNAEDQLSNQFGDTNLGRGFGQAQETAFPDDTQRTERMFQGMLAQSKGQQSHVTIAQTHIKGDSYPPTSAGAPSVVDQPEQGKVGRYNMPAPATEQPNFGKPQFIKSTDRQRAPLAPNPSNKIASLSHQNAKPFQVTSEPDTPIDDVAPGFAFTANPARKLLALPSNKHRSGMSPRPDSPAIPNHAPQPHEKPRQRMLQQVSPVINNNAMPTRGQESPRARPQDETDGRSYQYADGRSGRQQKMPDEAPMSDAYTEYEQGENQSYDTALDYDPSELNGKDVRSLQAEPFDQGPNAQPFNKIDAPESATLTDKVARLVGADSSIQAEFFASLGIDEWEEAGDWFLDQFGQTLSKLTNLRREKRKAALSFEDEVRARDDAIVKKRKITEAAMGEMKSSGAALLMGTPGKGR